MASHANFQNNEQKYKNVDNIFVRKAKTGKKDTKSENFWENFIKYISYYRDNPHRFCIEYLGIYLHWWQQVVIYSMWFSGNIIFLASRGSGKSYLTMVYCVAKCVLMPGTIIRVAAANKKQAGMLLAKIKEIQRNCPMVKREIKDIHLGKDESRIIFHGGSEIATVVAGDGARGERCQIVIVDEREIVDKDVIDTVFIPFLTATRQVPYLKKQKYRHLIKYETNHFIELSSIGSKSSSLYKEFEDYIGFMDRGLTEEYSVFSIPYQIPLSSGVINRKIIQKMIRENTTGTEAFKQEMEVIPSGDGEGSVFRFEDLNKCRKLHVPLIPISDEEFMEFRGDIRKYKYYQKKNSEEIRLLAMDVAQMGGRSNDASVYTVFRLTKSGTEYIKEISYIESINGENIDLQTLRLKQLYYDLECDFVVLDCGGIGQTIFDLCTKKTEDTLRGKIYPAWCSMNKKEVYNTRVMDESAVEIIHAVKISGATAHSQHARIVAKARLVFKNKKAKLLVQEDEAIETLNKRYKYKNLVSSNSDSDNDEASRLIRPFMETTKFIKEGIETQVITKADGISITEKGGRKDRLMSMLYGLSYIDLLEEDLQAEDDDDDDFDPIICN